MSMGNCSAARGSSCGPPDLDAPPGVFDRPACVRVHCLHSPSGRIVACAGAHVLVDREAPSAATFIVPEVHVVMSLDSFHSDPAANLHCIRMELPILMGNYRALESRRHGLLQQPMKITTLSELRTHRFSP